MEEDRLTLSPPYSDTGARTWKLLRGEVAVALVWSDAEGQRLCELEAENELLRQEGEWLSRRCEELEAVLTTATGERDTARADVERLKVENTRLRAHIQAREDAGR